MPRVKAEQLRLDLEYGKVDVPANASEEVENFFYGDISGQKGKIKLSPPIGSSAKSSWPKVGEIWFSQRKTSYTYKSCVSSIETVWQVFARGIRRPDDGMADGPYSRYGNIAYPVYYKVRCTKTGATYYDMAFALYPEGNRDQRREGSNPTARLWIHTEFEKPSNIMVGGNKVRKLKTKKSWFAIMDSESFQSPHFKYFFEYIYSNPEALKRVSWAEASPTDMWKLSGWKSGRAKYIDTFRVWLENLDRTEVLSLQRSRPWRYPGHLYYPVDLRFQASLNDNFQQKIVEGLFSTLDPEVQSKSTFKWCAKLISDDIALDNDITDCRQLGRLIQQVFKIIKCYDNDINFLRCLEIEKLTGNASTLNRKGERLRIAYAMAETEFFQKKFSKTKQWRLLAEAIGSEVRPGFLGDALRTLASISQHMEVSEIVEFNPRRVKNLSELHDELAKLYVLIKHKPVDLGTEFVPWLDDIRTPVAGSEYEIVVPETTNDIRTWGQQQRHCLGSYADRMAEKRSIVLGVWSKEKGEWLGHMDVKCAPLAHLKYFVVCGKRVLKRDKNTYGDGKNFVSSSQFYGKRNSAIDAHTRRLVIAFLNEKFQEWAVEHVKEDKTLAASAAGTAMWAVNPQLPTSSITMSTVAVNCADPHMEVPNDDRQVKAAAV